MSSQEFKEAVQNLAVQNFANAWSKVGIKAETPTGPTYFISGTLVKKWFFWDSVEDFSILVANRNPLEAIRFAQDIFSERRPGYSFMPHNMTVVMDPLININTHE